MKISHLIFLSFLYILILFSITTYINSRQSEQVKENADYVSRSGTILRNTTRFQRNILNMVSGLRGYLLTGEKYFVESYDSSSIENDAILAELDSLIDDVHQKKQLQDIQELNNKWVDEFATPLRSAKMLAIVHDSNLNEFNRIYREKVLVGSEKDIHKQLQQRFREFSNYEYEIRESKRQRLAESVRKTRLISFYLNLVSLIIGLGIISFITYRISTRIRKMVKMADDIASGNYKVYVEDSGKDELNHLARSLNHMAKVLSENISELKAKNAELNQFAHIVSHDLKGPLRGIDNVVSWIEEDHSNEMSPKMSHYMQLIKGRIARAENLINGILSYAQIGKEKVLLEEVDLNQLLKEVVENIKLKPGTNVTVQHKMPVLTTERLLLYQVFSNLIDNAVKYNDKDQPSINIYFEERTDHFEFFVQDNGPGIDKKYHDRIFIIFQTLNDRDSFESTGVGLAIVKKILNARKEHIHIHSDPGRGSIFSFTWSKQYPNEQSS